MTKRAFSDNQLPAMASAYQAGKTFREVAAEYGGGSDVSVRRALVRFGVQPRTARQSVALRNDHGIDNDELVQLYCIEHHRVADLARHFHVRNQAVTERLRELGVELRPGGVLHPAFDTAEKCDDLATEYREVGNVHTLAERHHCSAPTIVNALHRAGQSSVAKGREAPFRPTHSDSSAYMGTWTTLRTQVVERDGRRCRACGHPETDRTRKLTAAHLVPVVAFTDTTVAHQLDNLVTLCRQCHRSFDMAYYTEWDSTLGNRRFWPAWAQARVCGDCGSSNVVSVPLAVPVG